MLSSPLPSSIHQGLSFAPDMPHAILPASCVAPGEADRFVLHRNGGAVVRRLTVTLERALSELKPALMVR